MARVATGSDPRDIAQPEGATMEQVVRAVDVGSGNTKLVIGTAGSDIRCVSFPSVAYPSTGDRPAWAAGERRRTVSIPVGSLYYEVGPDVSLAADTFRAKQLHDDYTDSPEYLALLRGALAMMKVPRIDLLIVGLPVSLLPLKKGALEKLLVGNHAIGGGKEVVVDKVMAIAQPHGALVQFAAEHNRLDSIGAEQTLIIDPGSRTFDWLVARGMRLVQKQSSSINRGMSDVLRLVAAEIARDIGAPYRDLDAIDAALRGKGPLVLFQKPYDVKRHLALAESVAQQAVSTMRQWIETPESLQNIVLVGGAAFLFRKAVKAAFPRHRIHETKEPLFANVRGFQLAGQNYAATSMVGGRSSDQGEAS